MLLHFVTSDQNYKKSTGLPSTGHSLLICVHPTIHPSIYNTHFFWGLLEPFQAVTWRTGQGSIETKTNNHLHSHPHQWSNLSSQSTSHACFLSRRTHANRGRTCKLHRKRPRIKPIVWVSPGRKRTLQFFCEVAFLQSSCQSDSASTHCTCT